MIVVICGLICICYIYIYTFDVIKVNSSMISIYKSNCYQKKFRHLRVIHAWADTTTPSMASIILISIILIFFFLLCNHI